MKLTDLSPLMRSTLICLRDRITATRGEISDHIGLSRGQVSGALSRLECYGYVKMPEERGEGWTITKAGLALFTITPPDGEACAMTEGDDDAGIPPEEPAPDFTFADGGDDDAWMPAEDLMTHAPKIAAPDLANEIITAMKLELDMERVIVRLKAPIIPARASRIYHNLVAALPESIIEALAPITDIVKAYET
jgi:DNA-binding transcriptional ArsR family regulator